MGDAAEWCAADSCCAAGYFDDVFRVWQGQSKEENSFFYCTARVVVPIASLGLLRVESYENSQLLDWHTLWLE